MKSAVFALLAAASLSITAAAQEVRQNRWANVASDLKAAGVGDILTVVVYQSAEARNAADSGARRQRGVEGKIRGRSHEESGEIDLNSNFAGHGESRRSESFITKISVSVADVLPNGDLTIAGEQIMKVNGEKTTIQIRGRVRPVDISSDNQILSTRIADAQINYHGEGFVSRNAKSGVIGWLFSALGLGG